MFSVNQCFQSRNLETNSNLEMVFELRKMRLFLIIMMNPSVVPGIWVSMTYFTTYRNDIRIRIWRNELIELRHFWWRIPFLSTMLMNVLLNHMIGGCNFSITITDSSAFKNSDQLDCKISQKEGLEDFRWKWYFVSYRMHLNV